ncbi:CLUMA_CG010885, isoform A [Clunio marinus]|uniref:CLUMA_CG010885, isoform A n=1 Tax=Clunio marinus TaxID=568069 RepID=A0A1J1IB87_9DIPT|nr:CLUMA_CG010885, isoform A [Clunio marinus]
MGQENSKGNKKITSQTHEISDDCFQGERLQYGPPKVNKTSTQPTVLKPTQTYAPQYSTPSDPPPPYSSVQQFSPNVPLGYIQPSMSTTSKHIPLGTKGKVFNTCDDPNDCLIQIQDNSSSTQTNSSSTLKPKIHPDLHDLLMDNINSFQNNQKETTKPQTSVDKRIAEQEEKITRQAHVLVVDLDLELPRLSQKKENPDFKSFNGQLKKNKKLNDVRETLINNKYLSDVQFIIDDDQIFYGHKMILISSSFLFYEHFHVNGESTMKIDSIDPETFKAVISYCYTNKLQVTESNVLELLLVSNKLQIRQIANVCHGFITKLMNPETIFIIYEKAMENDNEVFKKKCLDYINKNEEKCFTSKGFYNISLSLIKKIVESCNYSSEKVNEIIAKYTQGNIEIPEDPKPSASVEESKGEEAKNAASKKQPKKKTTKPQVPASKASGKPAKAPNMPPMSPFYNQQMRPPLMHPQMRPPLMPPQMRPPLMQPFYNPQMCPPHMQPPMPPQMFAVPPSRDFMHELSTKTKKGKQTSSLVTLDDDDDASSIISKDDEAVAKTSVNVHGQRKPWKTEFSRIDFVCKRSFLLHEVRFTEDLSKKMRGEIKVTITVFEQEKRKDIHTRTLTKTVTKGKPNMKLNFIRFGTHPLKFYIGQKFFIKLNFSENDDRVHVDPENLTKNTFLELRKDDETKKYFNCVSVLTVSEMTTN